MLALTPLVDTRFVTALEDLRARRFDVAVVEVDPVPLVEPGRSEAEKLAYRIWLLEREVLRYASSHSGSASQRGATPNSTPCSRR